MTQVSNNTRAQVFSFEGISAAIIIILAVVFALSSTAITPLTASTSNQLIEEQNRVIAEDLLVVAEQDDEAITEFVVNYDGTEKTNSAEIGGRFGDYATQLLDRNDVAFNIYLSYIDNGEVETTQAVNQGIPTDHSASAQKQLVIMENQVDDESETFIPNEYNDSQVHNVVTVQIEVWTM